MGKYRDKILGLVHDVAGRAAGEHGSTTTVKAHRAQVEPAANHSVTMRKIDQEKGRVHFLKDEVLGGPVLVVDKGKTFDATGQGADVGPDGAQFFEIARTGSALIGTSGELAEFLARHSDFVFALPERVGEITVVVSPFIPLAEKKRWEVIKPREAMAVHMTKSVAALGAGVGAGFMPVPGGSLPLADLADFFTTVTSAVGDAADQDEVDLHEWKRHLKYVAALYPSWSGADSPYAKVKHLTAPNDSIAIANQPGHADRSGYVWRKFVRVSAVAAAVAELTAEVSGAIQARQ